MRENAGRNHDAVVGREGVDVGIDVKLDGYGAGDNRDDHPHFIDAIAPGQNLDRPFTIAPHITADPIGRTVTWDRFIIESQKPIPGFDACHRSR